MNDFVIFSSCILSLPLSLSLYLSLSLHCNYVFVQFYLDESISIPQNVIFPYLTNFFFTFFINQPEISPFLSPLIFFYLHLYSLYVYVCVFFFVQKGNLHHLMEVCKKNKETFTELVINHETRYDYKGVS